MIDTQKLRQRILDLAIRGKLVPQDPNDEPASVLLERIRDEKERLIKEGKIKRPKAKKPSDKSHYQQDFQPPFDIPASWEWVRLGDISNSILGKMLDKSKNKGVNHHYLRNINVRWFEFDLSDLSEMPFEILETQRYSIIQGDLVICEGGEPGRCAVWSQSKPIMFQKALHRVRFYGGISSHFIANIIYLYCLTGFITKYFTGSSIKHLTGESLANIPIPVPPLNEQARILETIVSFNHIIYEIKHNKDILIKGILSVKTRILDLAMQGKLVQHDPTDEPASETLLRINPKAKIITDNPHYKVLPKLWILCTLESVANIRSAKRVMKNDWKNSGIPFYRTREIIKLSHDGYVDNQLYISHELYDSYKDKYGVPKTGDIMLTAVGTIGETYIVKVSDLFYYKDASVLCIQPINDLLDSGYFCLFIRSDIAQKQIHNQSKGTTVDTITIEKANNYTFILPPLKEQKRLVAEVEKLYSILDEIEANLQS